jgi:hypothetical protein
VYKSLKNFKKILAYNFHNLQILIKKLADTDDILFINKFAENTDFTLQSVEIISRFFCLPNIRR